MRVTENLIQSLREERGDFDESKPVCLIVEDDDNDALLSERALKAMGADVKRVSTADDAIDLLEVSKHKDRPDFDIVFLDIKLAGPKNGYDVLRHIRRNFKRVHVVVVSGFLDEDLLNHANNGARGYIGIIRKPLERVDVSEIFEKHRLVHA